MCANRSVAVSGIMEIAQKRRKGDQVEGVALGKAENFVLFFERKGLSESVKARMRGAIVALLAALFDDHAVGMDQGGEVVVLEVIECKSAQESVAFTKGREVVSDSRSVFAFFALEVIKRDDHSCAASDGFVFTDLGEKQIAERFVGFGEAACAQFLGADFVERFAVLGRKEQAIGAQKQTSIADKGGRKGEFFDLLGVEVDADDGFDIALVGQGAFAEGGETACRKLARFVCAVVIDVQKMKQIAALVIERKEAARGICEDLCV